ncbi:MAG: hypothetical protein ABIK92_01285 [Pseudomonadota bacterium]
MKQFKSTMVYKTWADQIADFLKFLNEARSYLKQNKVSKHHPDVLLIRSEVEKNYHDDNGKPATYQKYESTFCEDACAIVTLFEFFQKYEYDQLHHYHKLTMMELAGLKGDYHPLAILGRSALGKSALLLSSITIWWGLIKLVSEDDHGKLFSELLHSLLSPAMINRIVGMIWLVGMFVVVWYVLRMVRNRKQVAFLSSLSRALELYLDNYPET